jgi:hypothetical protein
MKRSIFLILSFISVSFLHAQKIVSYSSPEKTAQFARTNFEIHVNGAFRNPHDLREVTLDMIATSPSGKKIVVPCYFELVSGYNWHARFAPQELGAYEYFFRLSIAGKSSSVSAKKKLHVAASDKDGFLHTNGYWTFRFDSGKPFRGIGENIGWESRSFENSKWTYDYLLPTLSNNGANFFRTWMCVWNLPVAWNRVDHTDRYANSTESFNASGIKRMDELVSMCDSLGLYFMLSIDAHGALIPDAEWKNNSHNKVNGGPASTPTEFFTHEESRAMYKNRLRYMIARWGYSPSIAAWEFFNEIDNAVFTPTPHDSVLIDHKIITGWHHEMSTFLKTNDPYHHIVTTSVSHRDIQGMNELPNIDLNQKHIYNKTHLIAPTIHEYSHRYKKPYVIGEFGYDWNWDNVKPEYGTNFDFDYKRGLWYGLFSPTPILPMTWWWEFFDERNMTPYFKSVRTISDMMLKEGVALDTVSVSSELSDVYAVKSGNTYFVYALNNANARGGLSISFRDGTAGQYSVSAFNPSEGTFKNLENLNANDGKLTLNTAGFNVHEDRVYILRRIDEKNATRAGSN